MSERKRRDGIARASRWSMFSYALRSRDMPHFLVLLELLLEDCARCLDIKKESGGLSAIFYPFHFRGKRDRLSKNLKDLERIL